MSQSSFGESSNSFNNNSLNKNTNLNSFDTNSPNTTNNLGNMNLGSAGETAEILTWLSPLESRVRHEDIREHRVEDMGDWFLQTEEYQNWSNGIHGGESNNSVLFCYGHPGAGKTYIR